MVWEAEPDVAEDRPGFGPMAATRLHDACGCGSFGAQT